MKNPPKLESIVLANQTGRGARDALSTIDKSKPIVASASILLAPSAFLTFIAMVGPSYFIAKIFELGGRQTVKYPGQLNSYVKDQSQFAGGITGIVEYLTGMGVEKFKDFVGTVAEFIPTGERPEIKPDDVEKLYNGILRYNDEGKMVPAGDVRPLSLENLLAEAQRANVPLHI